MLANETITAYRTVHGSQELNISAFFSSLTAVQAAYLGTQMREEHVRDWWGKICSAPFLRSLARSISFGDKCQHVNTSWLQAGDRQACERLLWRCFLNNQCNACSSEPDRWPLGSQLSRQLARRLLSADCDALHTRWFKHPYPTPTPQRYAICITRQCSRKIVFCMHRLLLAACYISMNAALNL
jgi:hypothetical protein